VYARVAGHEAIAAMISLGLGVGVLPELVVAASGVANAVQGYPVTALPPMVVGLCARRSRLADPVISSLWDVARRAA
jgi:LysR family positive regulator for ilvC